MNYQCPVCGYNKMKEPPVDFYICPCCGVEFGNDDFEFSHAQLREHWIDGGLRWFSSFTAPPPHWDPIAQLRTLGYGVETTSAASSKIVVARRVDEVYIDWSPRESQYA